jgi:hypothetical protein
MGGKTARDAAFNTQEQGQGQGTGASRVRAGCGQCILIDSARAKRARALIFFRQSARTRRGLVGLRAVIMVLEILW